MNKDEEIALHCITPFADFEITQNGDCYLCCPAWLPVVIGNVHRKNIDSIFNSAIAQKVRISMYRNILKHCDKSKCLKISSFNNTMIRREDLLKMNDLNEKAKAEILNRDLKLSSPSKITEAISEICNIKCKFCWTPYTKKRKDQAVLEKFLVYVVDKLDEIKMISFCGGEPFIQNHVKEIVARAQGKEVKFYFTSNLNFIDDRMKTLLQNINFDILHVSLNAASKQTYDRVVEGGDWDSVMRNLDFVLDLRNRLSIPRWLQISMVVTNRNYMDIIDFALLGIKIKADGIQYYPMNEYGIPEQCSLQIGEDEKREIREMLKHTVFEKKKRVIEIGTLKQRL